MQNRLIQLVTEWQNIADILNIKGNKAMDEDPHDSLAHVDLERADVYESCAEELNRVIKSCVEK